MPDIELAAAAANLREFWMRWGNEEPVDGEPAVLRTGVPFAFLNGVLRMRDGDVAAVLPGVRERLGGLPWLWHVGPDSPDYVAAEVEAAGGTLAFPVPVMAVPLHEVAPVDGPDGLEISTVTEPAELDEWTGLYAREFGWPEEILPAARRMEARRQDLPGTLWRYAGRIGGELVATAAVSDRHGVAGVFCVATRSDHRRRGVGGAVMNAVLAAARERGLRAAALESSPDGYPLYQRLGFTQVAESRWYQF
ncbi:GNAT family N-acetyltransferase [Actinoplanes sp. CA-054009]